MDKQHAGAIKKNQEDIINQALNDKTLVILNLKSLLDTNDVDGVLKKSPFQTFCLRRSTAMSF